MRLFLIATCCGFVFAQSPDSLEAVITTDLGAIRIEFAHTRAPRHVNELIERARQGYYDGSAFHRAIANGIAQGGDPLLKNPKTPRNLWGTGGLNLLPDEFSDLKHERGVVSAVRLPGTPNSGGSQFFICLSPQPSLDGKFSAFGRVTEGIDVAERISLAPVDENGILKQLVRIQSIAIEPKKKEPYAGVPVEGLRKVVRLKTTLGDIRIQMAPEWAPEHVRGFLKLVSTGWYNGTPFFRVVKGFVAQGGLGAMRAGGPIHPADRWVRPLKGEFRDDVNHVRGVVSMARNEDPDSATTSFFLLLGDAPHLDGKYSAFARVVEGQPVLEAFEAEELDGETPKRRIELLEASIEEAPAQP
jgi:cyclophilin family peptidyl-prolyl cis-trans isomerase